MVNQYNSILYITNYHSKNTKVLLESSLSPTVRIQVNDLLLSVTQLGSRVTGDWRVATAFHYTQPRSKMVIFIYEIHTISFQIFFRTGTFIDCTHMKL